jgi:hypothetical protein
LIRGLPVIGKSRRRSWPDLKISSQPDRAAFEFGFIRRAVEMQIALRARFWSVAGLQQRDAHLIAEGAELIRGDALVVI